MGGPSIPAPHPASPHRHSPTTIGVRQQPPLWGTTLNYVLDAQGISCSCLPGGPTRARAAGFATIRRWSGLVVAGTLAAHGFLAPSEPILGRTPQSVDVDLVDYELGRFLAGRSKGMAVAVDGRTVRGAVGENAQQLHLQGVLVHKQGVVIGQLQVDGKHNEIAEFKPQLEPVDLEGKLVTADAMHTQRELARYPVEGKHADQLFVTKGNQSALAEALAVLDDRSCSPAVIQVE